VRAEARSDAKRRWDKAVAALNDHPYCKLKCVTPDNLRMETWQNANPLLVPMFDEKGKLVTGGQSGPWDAAAGTIKFAGPARSLPEAARLSRRR
jgi:hypothetical protein